MILGRVGRCRKLLVVVTSERNVNLINFVEVKRLANLPSHNWDKILCGSCFTSIASKLIQGQAG